MPALPFRSCPQVGPLANTACNPTAVRPSRPPSRTSLCHTLLRSRSGIPPGTHPASRACGLAGTRGRTPSPAAPRGIHTTWVGFNPRQTLGPCWGHSGLDVSWAQCHVLVIDPKGVSWESLCWSLGPTCPKGTGSPSLQSCWRAPGEGDGPVPGTTEWLWKRQKEGGRRRAPWAPEGGHAVWPRPGQPFSAGGSSRNFHLVWFPPSPPQR